MIHGWMQNSITNKHALYPNSGTNNMKKRTTIVNHQIVQYFLSANAVKRLNIICSVLSRKMLHWLFFLNFCIVSFGFGFIRCLWSHLPLSSSIQLYQISRAFYLALCFAVLYIPPDCGNLRHPHCIKIKKPKSFSNPEIYA